MSKFTKLKKGTFVKQGMEYDYILEISDDFPKRKYNARLRIIDERPAIRKIRTRYDPEITMFGDKNASMELALGYNMKEINSTLRRLLLTLLMPFYMFFVMGFLMLTPKIPRGFLPPWTAWMLWPVLVALIVLFFRLYFKMNMFTLAEYLKANDLKKILKKEGFKQTK